MPPSSKAWWTDLRVFRCPSRFQRHTLFGSHTGSRRGTFDFSKFCGHRTSDSNP
ncbi:hypothetical protein K438DRAFT_1843150 [Mycena galopus ATCC 62051]|nr:hypothetical protein K438DRAFT_1843150 [Mycena galopus ATCC 62051]